jgi:hypothetical protein
MSAHHDPGVVDRGKYQYIMKTDHRIGATRASNGAGIHKDYGAYHCKHKDPILMQRAYESSGGLRAPGIVSDDNRGMCTPPDRPRVDLSSVHNRMKPKSHISYHEHDTSAYRMGGTEFSTGYTGMHNNGTFVPSRQVQHAETNQRYRHAAYAPMSSGSYGSYGIL